MPAGLFIRLFCACGLDYDFFFVPAGLITTIYCACGPLFARIYCACGFDYNNMLCLRAWSPEIFVPAGLFTRILCLPDCLQEFVVSTGLAVLIVFAEYCIVRAGG